MKGTYLVYGLHGNLETVEASRFRELHLLAESVGQVLHHNTICTYIQQENRERESERERGREGERVRERERE